MKVELDAEMQNWLILRLHKKIQKFTPVGVVGPHRPMDTAPVPVEDIHSTGTLQ